jgi:hypothetical protein
MPGMTSGVGTDNVQVTEAFKSALRHQLFIVAAIFLLRWLARLMARSIDALAAVGSKLTVWRLARRSAAWRQFQVPHVRVQYGSSG